MRQIGRPVKRPAPHAIPTPKPYPISSRKCPRNAAAVFTFTPAGNSTLVRLTQTGSQSGPQWQAAYEYLSVGNAQLLYMLHHRFLAGPTDWKKKLAEPASK